MDVAWSSVGGKGGTRGGAGSLHGAALDVPKGCESDRKGNQKGTQVNFTHPQLKILAFSAVVARVNQPAGVIVLQYILGNLLRNLSWQQEMNHEEEARARSVGTRSLGRHPGTAALMIRLLLVLSPEWVRLVLWHALRERYALPNATTATAANMVIEDNVEVTIAEPVTN
jgi:hypothetical protein